jgi:hypothetical protein
MPRENDMKPLWIAIAATLLSCGCAFAQVGGIGTAPIAPLGVTSPLGPGTAVGPIGIPFGATELGSPGDAAAAGACLSTSTCNAESCFTVIPKPGPNGRSAGSISWAGLLNCYFWLDPVKHVTGALFTQVLPFYDERVVALYGPFERGLYAGLA